MSECVHDFEIGSRYCVHCGQGAAELLYHAKARIAELEKCNKHRQAIIEELERRLTPKQCGECHLKPAEICDICGAMGGGENGLGS